MQYEPIGERARDRWPGILAAIGIPSKALRNVHGPCPLPGCGGKDRFRFDDKGGKGTWICNRCGAGDGVKLVMRFKGVGFKGAVEMIEQHIGAVPLASAKPSTDEWKRQLAVDLWERGRHISDGDPVDLYIRNRGISLPYYPRCLRYGQKEVARRGIPTMLALVEPCDDAKATGEGACLHRTYLDYTGRKADVPTQRKLLGTVPTGGAVRLMAHDELLGIAEGIETALAASILFELPVWAALSAGQLEKWVPPPSVREVVIFGDNDASFAGQHAACALAKGLRSESFQVELQIPSEVGTDWADVLAARR